MGRLILPNDGNSVKTQSSVPFMAPYWGYGEITGKPASVQSLFQEMFLIRRSDALHALCWLNRRAAAPLAINPEVQQQIANQFLADDLLRQLRQRLREVRPDSWSLFHRQQMWLLFTIAMLCCREDVEPLPPDEKLHAIGKCCLMANDILAQLTGDGTPVPTTDEGKETWGIWKFCSIATLNSAYRFEVDLARCKAFWFDLPRQLAPAWSGSQQQIECEFDEAFRAEHGISLADFLLVGLSACCFFLVNSTGEPALFEPRSYFHNEQVANIAETALSYLSRSPDSFALDILRSPRQSWHLDFTYLRAFPLIELWPGRFACADLELLARALTEGVYWRLRSAYDNAGRDFPKLFGSVYEAYIHSLMDGFANRGPSLARQFYRGPRFEGRNEQVCDGLLVRDDLGLAVLAEYKSSLLSPHQLHSGDKGALLQGIEDAFARDKSGRNRKGTGQLAQSIKHILDGELVAAPSADPSPCPDLRDLRLLPMILIYQEGLQLHATRSFLERRFRKSLSDRGVSCDAVGPLLLLSLQDIEMISELALHQDVGKLLDDYAQSVDVDRRDLFGSFHNYVCCKGNAVIHPRNSPIMADATAILEWAEEELKRRIGS